MPFLIVFFIALIWLLRLLRNRKIKRYIENIPTSTLRSLAVGLAEVNGKIIKPSDGTILHSPITNAECVFYRASVKVRKKTLVKRGNDRFKLKEIFFEGKYLNPFTIDDGTGLVNVNLEGANYPIAFERDTHQILKVGDNPKFDKFCADRNISTKGLFSKKTFHFSETFLEPGTNLYILGNAKNLPGSDKSRLTMCKDDYYERLFTVSEKSESEVLKTKSGSTFWITISLLIVLGSLYFAIDLIIDSI
tara:strand:+ start:3408 stop:4151 length:744 start_codon:yes stop_codon:yes gene_type:complete